MADGFGSNKELNYTISPKHTNILLFLHDGIGQFCHCGDAGLFVKGMSGNDWFEQASIIRSGWYVVASLFTKPLTKLFVTSCLFHKFLDNFGSGLLQ